MKYNHSVFLGLWDEVLKQLRRKRKICTACFQEMEVEVIEGEGELVFCPHCWQS